MTTREQWLENRKKYITGSDASAIIGENPYRSNQDVFNIKTGRKQEEDISSKEYVKYGVESEPHLRELFKIDFPAYDVIHKENELMVCEKYPFMAGSLDGLIIEKETGRLGIIEIKTSHILSSQHREKWLHGNIPQNYFVQCVHYMIVANAEFCILKAKLVYQRDGIKNAQINHYTIERKEVQDSMDYLIEKEKEFFECLKADRLPDLLLPSI